MKDRVQKLLSQWGVASRRQAEVMIEAGRVTVNGELAYLGQKADPALDVIQVDGKRLNPLNRPQLSYLLVNKPRGVVSTCDDPQGRKTVLDLLPDSLSRSLGIHPVGRLDTDSTGALLLTNDGQFTYQLTHPRHQIPKTYRVTVQGKPTRQSLNRWRQGLMLEGRKTLPAVVKVFRAMPQNTELEVILREGRNRQIRRVAEALGYPVLALHRTAIGSLGLKGLARGAYRSLAPGEVHQLTTGVKRPAAKRTSKAVS